MLTLLGLQTRYFPFPPWCDRQRVAVVPDDVPIVGPLIDVHMTTSVLMFHSHKSRLRLSDLYKSLSFCYLLMVVVSPHFVV